MSLRNPLFRSLIRCVIAGDLQDMKKAYRLVFSEFGKNTEKASEAIWRGKDTPPYNAIGFDRISKNTVKNVCEVAQSTVFSDILDYIKRGSVLHMTEVDIGSGSDINKLKTFKRSINEKLYREHGYKSLTVDAMYTILNVARIDQELQEIIANPNMYARIMDDTQTKSPGYPQGKFSSEYSSIVPMNMRVVLRYIDSFEN